MRGKEHLRMLHRITRQEDEFLCLIPLVLLFTAWEILCQTGVLPATIAPPPSSVLLSLINHLGNPSFLSMVVKSFINLVTGILLALVAATPLAIGAGLRKRFDSSLTPMVILAGGFPDLALLPILVLWFGPGEVSAVFMATICAFFPIYFTVREGVKEIPPELFQVSTVFHSSKFDLLKKLVFPAVSPQMLTGLRLSFDFVWEVILAIEIIARVTGVGSFINLAVEEGSMENAFAGILTVGLLCITADRCFFGMLEKRLRKWA